LHDHTIITDDNSWMKRRVAYYQVECVIPRGTPKRYCGRRWWMEIREVCTSLKMKKCFIY